MASNEGSNKSSKGSDKLKLSTSNLTIPQPIPTGFMPKLPAEDDKVDLIMTGIEVNAYLSTYPAS